MRLRIGIDVGGTFTDVTAFDEDQGEVIAIRKYSSNPGQPMLVMDEIAREFHAEFGPDSVALILHGSTAALNTMLEGKGVRVGLITTQGFRDVYEIGRQWRGADVFNMYSPAPKMLLTRDRVVEVRERLDYQGEVVEPIDIAGLERAVAGLVAQKVDAIAVSFLFSYANPRHEQAAAEVIRRLAPQVYVSLSSDVNPQWREYERTASAVANAYIGPPTARYLQDLERLSQSYFPQARILMMKSDGGAASAAMLAATPVQTMMSGPVAGVIGSRHLGDIKGIENLLSFDVGGTSTDMAVIPGLPLTKSELTVARHPVRSEAVDIDTIGAGGGSLASIQLGGVLKVGPQSAGARPGPACYMRGGTDATLTDALVVLGHLNPKVLLDGKMPIDSQKSHDAVMKSVGHELGMSAADAAWGILTVLSANVVAAMRTITVERGYDPREFTLIPFGGMGPTTANKIAADLGVCRILVPRDPGTFSAYGMLVTDIQQERSVTRLTRLAGADVATLDAMYQGLEEKVCADLLRENVLPAQLKLMRYAGMRYAGQSYEVLVPVTGFSEAERKDMAGRFHAAHLRRYGHSADNQPVEIVTFKVVGLGVIPKPRLRAFAAAATEPVVNHHRPVHFGPGLTLDTPIYRRALLTPGMEIRGPAVIEEQTSTTVLYPGELAHVDEYLNLEITLPTSESLQ
jgi:N-methylhydantoinase A